MKIKELENINNPGEDKDILSISLSKEEAKKFYVRFKIFNNHFNELVKIANFMKRENIQNMQKEGLRERNCHADYYHRNFCIVLNFPLWDRLVSEIETFLIRTNAWAAEPAIKEELEK